MHRNFSMSAVVAFGVCALTGLSGPVQAATVPVTFGDPDNVQFGDAPLPASSSFDLSWDFDNSGAVSSILRATCQCSSGYSSIVPSPSGHAINTKGAGANDRITFAQKDGTKPPVKIQSWIKDAYDRVHVVIDTGGGADDNGLLLLDIVFSSPRGWESHGDPHVDFVTDGDTMEIFSDFFPPANDTSDPNLPDVVMSFSATAIPAPGAMALLGMGGLITARRRR